MRYLLDIHAFLWWMADDPRLSKTARSMIQDGDNDVIFSAVTAWEIAIKSQMGRRTIRMAPKGY